MPTRQPAVQRDEVHNHGEHRAYLVLLEGQSDAARIPLSSAARQLVTIGSGADATWRVRAENVASSHVSLHWDGSLLSIADTYQTGDIRLNDTVVGGGWRPVGDGARIVFGGAVIALERANTDAPALEVGSRWRSTSLVPIVAQPPSASSDAWRDQKPFNDQEATNPSGGYPNAEAVYTEEESWQGAPRSRQGANASARQVHKPDFDSVLVLSPHGSEWRGPGLRHLSGQAPGPREIPSWSAIALGILVTLVTYGCLIYLLDRL